MLLACLMFIGIAAVTGQFTDINAIDDRGSYEFIYHADHSLLLTIHEMGCYFTHLDPRLHLSLTQHDLPQLEKEIEDIIRQPSSERKQGSTWEDMRDKYGDMLADWHCKNSDVYTIQLDYAACDFDHPLSKCGWIDNHLEPLQWRLNRGETTSLLTGPEGDHTSGSGHYLYLEANYGSEGEAAEIISPTIQLSDSNKLCLRFWYNMYGSATGNLSVIAESHNNSRQQQAQLLLIGEQGQGWKAAEVTIPVKQERWTSEIKLKMRATRGVNLRGDIAIDDIKSFPGSCISSQLTCSFEKDFCAWSEVGALDQLDWVRHSGPSPSSGQGPSSAPDISAFPNFPQDGTGNAYYIYMDGTLGKPANFADLQSPVFRIREPFCLNFLYYMNAPNVGELDVILEIRERVVTTQLLWHQAGRQGDQWLPGLVTVSYTNPHIDVQILFRATRGSSMASDIAIDHIIGQPGPCDQPQIIG